jgi:cell division protein FtsZ
MEGGRRMTVAETGISELAKYVDSLITIPNQKLLTVLGCQTTLLDAFKSANQVLQGAVQGIAELITRPGLINVDFADVRTVMSEMGMAMMGTGKGTGEDRAREAAEAAISSPLLEDINLEGAKGILVNVTAGMDLSIGEFDEVGMAVKERASDDATVVVGTVIDPAMEGEIRVTVVATGLGGMTGRRDQRPEIRAVHEGRRPVSRGQRPSYEELEKPTSMRRREEVEPRRAVGQSFDYAPESSDLLDIPAFLRRQAD